MKKYILVTLLMTGFLGGAFAQDSLTINPPKRKSLAFLYGSSDLWYQNYLSRRDYLQTYTHFGLQYAVEVKKNVDAYATLLYGARGVKNVASAGLGLRYYLIDRESHDKFRPFANFSGEVMMDNSTPTTFSDVDFTGSIGTGFDFKIVGALYGRAMVNLGFPFFQIGQVDFTDGRGTYTHYTAGLVYDLGKKSKSTSSAKKADVASKAPSVMKAPQAVKAAVIEKSTTTEIAANTERATTIEKPAITEVVVATEKATTVEKPATTEVVASAVTAPAAVKAVEPPVIVDSDGDQVPDKDDLMPTVAGLMALQGVPELSNLYFDTNEFKLTAESVAKLELLLGALKTNAVLKLILTGHTDSRSSVKYNQILSRNRVQETRKYLLNKGVEASRIKVSWHSELEPSAPNDTEEGRRLNRRVEVRIQK
ncbi:MAG: Outer rane porin precursor [Bacteroidota bacterium]|jgi:outer membrane protein OmpA-like peptidoglycan-associated protein